MPAGRSNEHFQIGAGTQPEAESYCCAECGYTHTKKKLFKQSDGGLTCSTGHYEDKQGQPKRARNPYATR
jgi:hypothetical protein